MKIAVGHFHGAYLPGIDRLKALIDGGRIGRLLEMHAHGKHDHRGGGEDMMDLGIHLFNLMQYLAGEVAWMSAHVTAGGREITPQDVHEATEPLGPVAGDHIHSYFAFHSGVVSKRWRWCSPPTSLRSRARESRCRWRIGATRWRRGVETVACRLPSPRSATS